MDATLSLRIADLHAWHGYFKLHMVLDRDLPLTVMRDMYS